MGAKGELLELARHLKQERLFITSERQHLQSLNEKVLRTVERLFHLSWTAKQQRINLDALILAREDCSPSLCCQRANILESVVFIDAYKQIGFHEPLYGDFLQQLRSNPKLIAMCLVAAEKIKIDVMRHAVNVITSSVYGNCILQEDENYVLNLLRYLMELQLATSDDPRRLLRHGSCAFSRVYKTLNEGHFSAKLFLTAALHDPIVHLLMEDELFLDIDPSKAIVRFLPQERLRRFGKEGTAEFTTNLQRYRTWTINKLVNLTNRFINSIKENTYCFPSSLIWLVKQLYHSVSKASKIGASEIGAMCADLVFSFFICPAIVNPEPYGIISDTPISYTARFNLMQVAQILQVLAMSKWEEIDVKLMDVYGKFEKECISSLLDFILDDNVDDNPPEFNSQLEGLTRSAVLISEPDLLSLVALFRKILAKSGLDESNKKVLASMLANLPVPTATSLTSLSNSSDSLPTNGTNSTSHTPPQTPSSKRTILNKVSKSRSRIHFPLQNNTDDDRGSDELPHPGVNEEVLVITLNNSTIECPGMLSEQRVLSLEQQNKQSKVRLKLGTISNEEECMPSGSGEMHEKRTRFSLSHDQDSIGTSDNLEAISEAASNHSVASSLELENENENENENDNLSDMMSANVSGRGTPNVSGRDTPSSQAEGEELREGERPLNLPVNANKQNQEDIDDKFGKFDIRPLIEGDETISMVSDTWSTDVLASDSETVEPQPDRAIRDVSISDNSYVDPQLMSFSLHQHNALDLADAGSEAWSTDVLVSDSERMQDVDTDDTGSVARSDDTASIARSDDANRYEMETDVHDADVPTIAPSEHVTTDENITPRASGSRSPIDPLPAKIISDCQQSIKKSVERLNFQPIKESDSFPAHSDETESTDAAANSTLLQMFDPFNPENRNEINDQIDSSIQLRKSPPSVLLSDSWERGEPCKPTEVMGMQSLGRLSISLGELPESGILSADGTAVFSSGGSGEQVNRPSDCCVESLRSLHRSDNDRQQLPMNISSKQHIIRPTVRARTCLDLNDIANRDDKKTKMADSEVPSGVRLSSGSLTSSISSSSSGGSGGGGENNVTQDSLSVPVHTGAIPKSISFDKTAERGDKDVLENDPKNKKSFFKNLKLPFKSTRQRKSSRSHEDIGLPIRTFDKAAGGEVFRDDSTSNYPKNMQRTSSDDPKVTNSEVGDDILAKYRKKPTESTTNENEASLLTTTTTDKDKDGDAATDDYNHNPSSSSNNPTDMSYAFADAKRKLRLVLSSADVATLPWGSSDLKMRASDYKKQNEGDLVAFLKMQHAEAVNMQDRSLVAQLLEALRCVQLFDKEGTKKLFRSLREDYANRAPYIAYLVRCRQGLLTTLAHLERILNRIERDKSVCNKFMISVCVRLFLEKRERAVGYFIEEFQKLTVSDEKTDLVEKFLHKLYKEMEADPLWQAASEEQTKQAEVAIERSIMSQMYIHALYPNGDGDVLRDRLISEHIQKLKKILTPTHRYLSVPKIYHYECPWPAAQAEIITINAYKTPRDKLHCVLRCCNTILHLLRLANEKSVPAADDFTPVFIYVLVKANPSNLLSTIQYVNSFYQKNMIGEEEYWWAQFCSAVEFIKTMEYED